MAAESRPKSMEAMNCGEMYFQKTRRWPRLPGFNTTNRMLGSSVPSAATYAGKDRVCSWYFKTPPLEKRG